MKLICHCKQCYHYLKQPAREPICTAGEGIWSFNCHQYRNIFLETVKRFFKGLIRRNL